MKGFDPAKRATWKIEDTSDAAKGMNKMLLRKQKIKGGSWKLD